MKLIKWLMVAGLVVLAFAFFSGSTRSRERQPPDRAPIRESEASTQTSDKNEDATGSALDSDHTDAEQSQPASEQIPAPGVATEDSAGSRDVDDRTQTPPPHSPAVGDEAAWEAEMDRLAEVYRRLLE